MGIVEHYSGGGATFKDCPNLIHGMNGIFIAHNAQIGKHCTIYQQVTIGIKDLPTSAPIIGDNVIIGAGAKIIGKIHIGNNVKIGANAVVVKDIPDNATVVGQQSRVIMKVKEEMHNEKY